MDRLAVSEPKQWCDRRTALRAIVWPHVSCLRFIMSQTRVDHLSVERWLGYGFALAALALISSIPATSLPVKKPSAGLEGSWSGGGTGMLFVGPYPPRA